MRCPPYNTLDAFKNGVLLLHRFRTALSLQFEFTRLSFSIFRHFMVHMSLERRGNPIDNLLPILGRLLVANSLLITSYLEVHTLF